MLAAMEPAALCRDCLTAWAGAGRCPACRSPRTLAHPELGRLSIAHLDCDAFYASVEKRDDPSLRDKPVIVGGGKRGVVTTACYIARIQGVRSAMPMFKALKLCPDAVVVRPRLSAYVEAPAQIRELMLGAHAAGGAALARRGLPRPRRHRAAARRPAGGAARPAAGRRSRPRSASPSPSASRHNKFLAKIASDLDKPRGFAVIGRAETQAFLARQPVAVIWGVGQAAVRALEAEGIRTIADLRARDRKALIRRFGSLGDRLWRLAQGHDARPVSPATALKSISHETTFDEDIAELDALRWHLWSLCEQVSARAKASDSADASSR